MKKTKIICSIGPASCNYDVMKEMVLSGMNIDKFFGNELFNDTTLQQYLNVPHNG